LTILILGSNCGCKTVYYQARFPVLEVLDRPTLDNIPATEIKKMSPLAQRAVGENFNLLIVYTRKLEVAIKNYNNYAEKQNKTLEKEK